MALIFANLDRVLTINEKHVLLVYLDLFRPLNVFDVPVFFYTFDWGQQRNLVNIIVDSRDRPTSVELNLQRV